MEELKGKTAIHFRDMKTIQEAIDSLSDAEQRLEDIEEDVNEIGIGCEFNEIYERIDLLRNDFLSCLLESTRRFFASTDE